MSNQAHQAQTSTLFSAPGIKPEFAGVAEVDQDQSSEPENSLFAEAMARVRANQMADAAEAGEFSQDSGHIPELQDGDDPSSNNQMEEYSKLFKGLRNNRREQQHAEREKVAPINPNILLDQAFQQKVQEDATKSASRIEFLMMQLNQRTANQSAVEQIRKEAVLTRVVKPQSGVGIITFLENAYSDVVRRLERRADVAMSDPHSGNSWTKKLHDMYDNIDGGAQDQSGA